MARLQIVDRRARGVRKRSFRSTSWNSLAVGAVLYYIRTQVPGPASKQRQRRPKGLTVARHLGVSETLVPDFDAVNGHRRLYAPRSFCVVVVAWGGGRQACFKIEGRQ